MGVCGPRIARGVLKCVKTDGPRYQLGCGDRNCHSQPAARIISVTDPGGRLGAQGVLLSLAPRRPL